MIAVVRYISLTVCKTKMKVKTMKAGIERSGMYELKEVGKEDNSDKHKLSRYEGERRVREIQS